MAGLIAIGSGRDRVASGNAECAEGCDASRRPGERAGYRPGAASGPGGAFGVGKVVILAERPVHDGDAGQSWSGAN